MTYFGLFLHGGGDFEKILQNIHPFYSILLILSWGGWGKIKIKDHRSPTKSENWAELGNNKAVTL